MSGSVVASLKYLDKLAKERKARRKGNDLQEVWHNCGLKVRAESGQILYPLVIKRQEQDYGYSLLLHLPKGLSDVSFRIRQHQIAWALGGDIEIEPVNGNLFLKVLTGSIKSKYDYHIVDANKMVMPCPIGYGRDGLTILDLATAPHLLVGGVPGSGKSNWLHQAIVTMLQAGTQVYIVDLKRLEFACYRKYACCVFKENEVVDVINALNKEMDIRMQLLEDAGVVKIQDYGEALPYIALVIDEVAELQDEKAWKKLNRLVRLSRALGISVIMATQRPSVKAVDGDTRGLLTARMAFRVPDKVNSQIIIDGPQAAYLPSLPGRAIYRNGNIIKEVQTMFLQAPGQVKRYLSDIPQRQQQLVQETELKTRA